MKVETAERVVCDTISDLGTAEMIADALNTQEEAAAKLSERKTVHEWLNAKGVPATENGKPICLLRRLAIALEVSEPAQPA